MIVLEVRNADLVDSLNQQLAEAGVTDAAIVTLIGAADSFTVSTMPASEPLKDNITKYDMAAEMTATGEVCNGFVHIHAAMAVEGDRVIGGHLHAAYIGAHFARAYVIPTA